jgi:hypothetical protein
MNCPYDGIRVLSHFCVSPKFLKSLTLQCFLKILKIIWMSVLKFYLKYLETTTGGVMQLDEVGLRQSQLTQKQKIVKTIFMGGQSFLVSGVGYNPHGNIYSATTHS